MGSHNPIWSIGIAFPCHLLHSSGGLLPLVCHLEPSVQFVFIYPGLTSYNPLFSSPSSSSYFLPTLLSSGGPGRPFNSPETVDVLPQSQADLFPARVRLPLQYAAQCVCHAWPHAAGYAFLRHFWPGVVSDFSISGWECKCKRVR